VGDKDVLKIFLRAKHRQQGIPSAKPKFIVGQNVRISKLKAKFEKSSAQNFSTEIFKIIKVIRRNPRPVYEMEDLNRTPIDGQFYQKELVPVRISRRTVYKIDKILSRRVRNGIGEVPVHWRGYPASLDSWIAESNVKKYKAMSADNFYITLFSNASVNCYPDNYLTAFTVDLARLDVLSASEHWEVGLCEFSFLPVPNFELVHNTYAFIYCNVIAPQLMCADCVRCLRCITWPQYPDIRFHQIQYMPVQKREFKTLSIAFIGMDGKQIELKNSDMPTRLVLHFRRVNPTTAI
jgi:hypothetical protein